MRAFAATMLCFLATCLGAAEGPAPSSSVRFVPVDIYLNSKLVPLAAYQIRFRATLGDVKIVGIEGGEHAAFTKAPYYDPKAIQQERVNLAAFSTAAAENLPKGKTRVATVHVRVSGEVVPQFSAAVQTAATVGGAKASVEVSVEERKNK
jgi:hypothetical protein